MEKILKDTVFFWHYARTVRPNHCSRCSMPSGIKLLCPRCGSSEYCSDACMRDDGKKHFTLCLGIDDSDQIPEVEVVTPGTSGSQCANLVSSQPPTEVVATILLWAKKRWVTDGRCTLCYKPSVGVQLLCSQCGKSEYCSASCMVEDGRNHFHFCNISVGSTQACPSNTWNSLQQDSATSLNVSLLSVDNDIMPPTTYERPFSSEFQFNIPWKSWKSPFMRPKSPCNFFRPVSVNRPGCSTIESPSNLFRPVPVQKHLPLKKRRPRTTTTTCALNNQLGM